MLPNVGLMRFPKNTANRSALVVKSLFANGEQGAWYDPSDFSTLFQDAAGTTPVTAVGQPIGKILDKSGRGNHATQATTANRPVLQQDAGGHYCLAFNGTNSSMASATGGGGNTGFFFCASVMPTGGAGTFRILFSDIGANTGYNVRVGVTDKLIEGAGNGTAFTTISTVASLNVGTLSDVTAWDDGINLNAQIDALAIASTARPLVVAGPGSFTLGKENGSASGFFLGNFYGVIYVNNSGLTASQRAAAQAWAKSRAGL